MSHLALLLTCEHASAGVPAEYRQLFASKAAQKALESHRGSDLGALAVARSLHRALGAPLYASSVTRLLVDLNRSEGHPRLLSEFSRQLGPAERHALLERYYFPHRDSVESWIRQHVSTGARVLHIGVHSFAARLDGKLRTADVGLLYDPSRSGERLLCGRWKSTLALCDPNLRVRRNYPYLGKSDGFVTYLRQCFAPRSYLGIELELNQSTLETDARRTAAAVIQSLAQLTAST